MRGVGGRHGAQERAGGLAAEGTSESALTEFHGLAPDAVAAHPTAPVTREQLDRARRAYPPRPPPLQPNRAGGVLTEQGTLPDVAAQHRRVLMPGLLGDDAFGDPGGGAQGRTSDDSQRGAGEAASRSDGYFAKLRACLKRRTLTWSPSGSRGLVFHSPRRRGRCRPL